jgi:hypothetical protein
VPISARTYSQSRQKSTNYLIKKLFDGEVNPTKLLAETLVLAGEPIVRYTGEFWTSKQRQACSLQEISYRACFKPQLPRFFIERLTEPGEIVYDPFMGRGTTIIESALLGRRVLGNDVNPLSRILAGPRLRPPFWEDVEKRLEQINLSNRRQSSLDLSMFYHPKTEREILALRAYLAGRAQTSHEDNLDRWIRMVATNRLTGHSKGFFSVYTLPPNQAMSQENQRRVNRNRRQKPEYRDMKSLILKKTKSLLRNISVEQRETLVMAGKVARLSTTNASRTRHISDNSVALIVTSPPFLDTVNYADDNWLRIWFNVLDRKEIASRLTMAHTVEAWADGMRKVFDELQRITRPEGVVAFEVGEIRKRNLRLDEVVVPIGLEAGFRCAGILVNEQQFTKTSNIWGIHNNKAGTNTNRIVLFQKPNHRGN